MGPGVEMTDNDASTAKTVVTKTRRSRKKTRKTSKGEGKRSRIARIYPALSFEESLILGEAIHTFASGERVSRLTLLKQMNLSPTSSGTQVLITTSGKYGITKGTYAAEHLELTPAGRVATDKNSGPRALAQARFELGIKNVKPFEVLYTKYRGKNFPLMM